MENMKGPPNEIWSTTTTTTYVHTHIHAHAHAHAHAHTHTHTYKNGNILCPPFLPRHTAKKTPKKRLNNE